MKHGKKFPKKPEKLNSISEKLLGVRSNTAGYKASAEAIYNQQPKIKDTLTYKQAKELAMLRRKLRNESYE